MHQLAWDLAFSANVDGKCGVWLLSHGQRRLLTQQFARAESAAWSPDGGRLAFAAKAGAAMEIYVLTLASRNIRQLTADKGFNDFPAWSPDGRSIAFNSHRQADGGDAANIYVIDADGTHERRYTTVLERTEHPTWSPDSNQLAFKASQTSPKSRGTLLFQSDIFVGDRNGTHIRKITKGPALSMLPAWSPAGHQIAFCTTDLKRPESLFDIRIDVISDEGTNVRRLARFPYLAQHLSPNWSPDGSQLAFHATETKDDKDWRPNRGRIFVMNIDGSHLIRLTGADADEFCPAFRPAPH